MSCAIGGTGPSASGRRRARGFLITTGLKANRALRVPAPDAKRGWRWQPCAAYAAGLTAADFTRLEWPRQRDDPDAPRAVYGHVVPTRGRARYRCQLVITRPALAAPAAPASATRYGASRDLDADRPTRRGHIAARWAVEVFFSDTTDVRGLDQYHLMTTTAIVRFWTRVRAAYTLIEEARARLAQEQQRHVTSGDARRVLQRLH